MSCFNQNQYNMMKGAASGAFGKTAKIGGMTAGAFAATILSSQSAMAALPAAIGTSLTEVQTDGLALADLVWPVLISLFGAVLLMKLFKRFASKV